MRKNESDKSKGRSLDDESQAMVYEGLNLSQLELMLEMDKRDIKEKIFQGKVSPCGQRNGADIYRLKDVMPWVVKPAYDVETYIKNMHHNELPKHLTKEFWAGQRSKQEYLERAGDLWPTSRVVDVVGDLFKLVKMQAQLASDAVERQVELSDKQRAIIKNIMDGMLNDLRLTIQEKFKDEENGDRHVSLEDEEETL